MRLAAQAKLGFYPAHPKAIELITKHLTVRPPDPTKKYDTINILDPCAGKGVAIRDLAVGLGVPEDHVYTVELDSERFKDIGELMPTSKRMEGPAGFMGVQITGYSFGLVYCNPPFDSELGGGRREEEAFADHSIKKLVPKGILVLVIPLKTITGNRGFVTMLDCNLEDIAVYKFPDGYDEEDKAFRPYNEIVIIGKKRATAITSDMCHQFGNLHKMNMQWMGYSMMGSLPPIGGVQPVRWNNGEPSYEREESIRSWEIPHSWKPHVFKKTAFTEEELKVVIAESPLGKLLSEVVIPPPAAPPLPLANGHLGLILASGMIDGTVHPPNMAPHVVRGSSHKVDYHNKAESSSTANPDTGAVTTKDVFSQRMVTCIRVVEQDGVIQTFSNSPEERDEDDNGDTE